MQDSNEENKVDGNYGDDQKDDLFGDSEVLASSDNDLCDPCAVGPPISSTLNETYQQDNLSVLNDGQHNESRCNSESQRGYENKFKTRSNNESVDLDIDVKMEVTEECSDDDCGRPDDVNDCSTCSDDHVGNTGIDNSNKEIVIADTFTTPYNSDRDSSERVGDSTGHPLMELEVRGITFNERYENVNCVDESYEQCNLGDLIRNDGSDQNNIPGTFSNSDNNSFAQIKSDPETNASFVANPKSSSLSTMHQLRNAPVDNTLYYK